MNDIRLENLTHRQYGFAEIMWECSSIAEVDRFVAGLPTREMKTEAMAILELMIITTIDQTTVNDTQMDDACAVLKQFTKKT